MEKHLPLIAVSCIAVGCTNQPSTGPSTVDTSANDLATMTPNHSIDAQYFIRDATYDLLDERVVVTDRRSPRVITLDPWLEVVFAAANGQRTVKQFIKELGSQYPDGLPPELEQQTKGFISKLVDQRIIKLIDKPIALPYYLSGPKSELDMEIATALMKTDGFILSE